MKFGLKSSVAVLSLTLLLAACGGGGGGTTSVTPTPTPTPTVASISGVVADGYLVGALVCSDQNDNKICDLTEPFAITTTNGQYVLQGDGVELHPILVEVGPTVIDEDTNATVAKPFMLMAPAPTDPAVPQVVSPMTTLVKHTMDQNPTLSRTQAAQSIKTQLGAPDSADLFADFIASQDAFLHATARVVTKAMANAQEEIKAAAAANGLNAATITQAVAKLVVQNAVDQLPAIVAAVANAQAAPNFNPKTFDVAAVATTAPATSQIVNDINLAAKPVIAVPAQSVLEAGGIFWLNIDPTWETERGQVTVSAASGQVSFVNEWFDRATATWLPLPQHTEKHLVNGAWTSPMAEGQGDTVVYNTDGSFNVVNATKGSEEKVYLVKKDLSGLNMASVLGADAIYLLDKKATFPQGSEFYQLTFESLTDLYQVSQWIDPSDPAATDHNYIATFGAGEQIIRSLADVESTFALNNAGNNYLQVDNFSVQFASPNDLKIFSENGNGPVEVGTGSYRKEIVQTKELLFLDIPAKFIRGIDKKFLVEMNDSVRGAIVQFGDFTPKNVVEVDTDLSCNQIARDAILSNAAISGVMPAAFWVQYRNAENPINSATRAYIQYVMLNPSDRLSDYVARVDLTGTNNLVVETDSSSTTDLFYMYDCKSGNCIDKGVAPEEYYFFSPLPTLPSGSYSFLATLKNGSTISTSITYPGQLVVPFIRSTTMQATWQQNGDLTFSWTNPTAEPGWDKVSQIRVFMTQGLMVHLNSSAQTITVPAAILAQRGVIPGSQWRIQARAYDANGFNYARSESNTMTIPTP